MLLRRLNALRIRVLLMSIQSYPEMMMAANRNWSAGKAIALVLIFVLVAGARIRSQAVESPTNEVASSAEVLARAQSAELERHYAEAIKILSAGLKHSPEDTALQLELGRAYLETGKDRRAEKLFRQILKREPEHREAQLELARSLAYQGQYKQSDALYGHLLALNAEDEAAAIGLTSNLIHEGKPTDAVAVADSGLKSHPNSLRLMEFKDRISGGLLGADERSTPIGTNEFSAETSYVDDSAGNHSWREMERLEWRINSQFTSETRLEQHVLHSLDDPLQIVATASETLHWRPLEKLAMTAGGGGVRFDSGDVSAIYETSLTGQVANHLLVGAGFSRLPVIPDAEAAEFRITAQGWDSLVFWAPEHWQVSARELRRHYTDGNIGDQESLDLQRRWSMQKLSFTGGYRFRHYGFTENQAHGYFSPDDYRSHQGTLGVAFQPNRKYRGEIVGRFGAESIASGASFQAAWEVHVRNQLTLGRWGLGLDYSRYHMAQFTGAFRADAARFELAYHF